MLLFCPHPGRAASPDVETIILVRHGEKPKGGLGQLDCQGLNRALALPAVIAKDFGTPTAIFAPNPAAGKLDSGTRYDYIRPLATIEPTAIALGMPVDVSHGVDDWQALVHAVTKITVRNAVILIAWEHTNLVRLARALMVQAGGDSNVVPDWDSGDFDSIYVLSFPRGDPPKKPAFQHLYEGLNGEPAQCAKAPTRDAR